MSSCSCSTQPVPTAEQEALNKLLDQYRDYEGGLIPVLQEAQEIYGYLPGEVMQEIAKELRMPFSTLYAVATFYAQFHFKPRGRNIIRICLGTACHVRGGHGIFESSKDHLGVGHGETTDDLRFTLETVACIGACGLAPCMMVNEDTHGRLKPAQVGQIFDSYQ